MKNSRNRARSQTPSVGPVARKGLEQVRRAAGRGRFDLSGIDDSGFAQRDFRAAAAADQSHREAEPLHALYKRANDRLVHIIERLVNVAPGLEKLIGQYNETFDLYTPGYPPISPLTMSYAGCWSQFDLCTSGAKVETLATVAIHVCRELGMNPALIAVFELMQRSRPGVYRHEGIAAGRVNLCELVTGEVLNVTVPSGHLGRAGELWLTRIMPVAFPEDSQLHPVTFTTPYLLGKNGAGNNYVLDTEPDWLGFFQRVASWSQLENEKAAYELFMKYPPISTYWLEYIHCAYRNHRADVIFLEGIPDRLDSLPHGDQARAWLVNPWRT